MLYIFPPQTYARVIADYDQPHDDPIAGRTGDTVFPISDGSRSTDFIGWSWCVGADGRAGWTPDSWCEPTAGGWKLVRDYNALELTVRTGDRLRLIHSESGFLFCETTTGERAWLPDAVVALER